MPFHHFDRHLMETSIQLVCFWSPFWPWSKGVFCCFFFLIKFQDKTLLLITMLVLLHQYHTFASWFNQTFNFQQIPVFSTNKKRYSSREITHHFWWSCRVICLCSSRYEQLVWTLFTPIMIVWNNKKWFIKSVLFLFFSWTSRLWPKNLQWGLCLWISLCSKSNSGIGRTDSQISPASWVFSFMTFKK